MGWEKLVRVRLSATSKRDKCGVPTGPGRAYNWLNRFNSGAGNGLSCLKGASAGHVVDRGIELIVEDEKVRRLKNELVKGNCLELSDRHCKELAICLRLLGTDMILLVAFIERRLHSSIRYSTHNWCWLFLNF